MTNMMDQTMVTGGRTQGLRKNVPSLVTQTKEVRLVQTAKNMMSASRIMSQVPGDLVDDMKARTAIKAMVMPADMYPYAN